MKKAYIIFGPPGVGKGTQSEYLLNKYGWAHISTGAVLRAEVEKRSELGNQVKAIMDKGDLVADEIVVKAIEQFILTHSDKDSFLFDGFPRTEIQAIILDELLSEHSINLAGIIFLQGSDDVLISRLLKRGETSDRAEDKDQAVIANRLQKYREQTLPVQVYYARTGRTIHNIDGVGSIEEVFSRISLAIEATLETVQ